MVTRTRTTRLLLATAIAVQLAAYAVLLHDHNTVAHDQPQDLALESVCVPAWAVAVYCLRELRVGRRAAAWLVLGVAALLQVVALTAQPTTSDDDYRYAWDAKVQLAGVDPYRYAPEAAELAGLRDGFVFPHVPAAQCPHPIAGGCTAINRPDVHTVYPPVAQAAFDVVRLVSFGGAGGHLPLQLAGAAGVLAIAGLLLRRLSAWRAALWAWSPLAVLEFGNNAHIDWLAVLFCVLALQARTAGRAGALCGAAVAVKLYPVLLLPSLLRRSWTAALTAAAVVVLVYVPHLVAVGGAVLGYLPGYLHEEGYGTGQRLQLLGAVLPRPADTVAGVLIVVAAGWWAWRRGPADPARSAVTVVGAALLVATPNYSWYAALLLALIALTGAVGWLPVACAPAFGYLTGQGRTVWFAAAALALTLALARRRRRTGVVRPSTSPARAARWSPRAGTVPPRRPGSTGTSVRSGTAAAAASGPPAGPGRARR